MRYPEVCARVEQFIAAREACGREWTISESLVMCVQLDVARLAAMVMPVAHSSSRTHGRWPSGLRVTMFWFGPSGVTRCWVDDPGVDPATDISTGERATIADYRTMVGQWVVGKAQDLPPSNSTRVYEYAQKLKPGS